MGCASSNASNTPHDVERPPPSSRVIQQREQREEGRTRMIQALEPRQAYLTYRAGWEKYYPDTFTTSSLESARHEFWDTRVTLRAEIWSTLKEVCACLLNQDEPTADILLESAQIQPLQMDKEFYAFTYDVKGNKYEIPLYCINTPPSLLPSSSTTTTVNDRLQPLEPQPQSAAAAAAAAAPLVASNSSSTPSSPQPAHHAEDAIVIGKASASNNQTIAATAAAGAGAGAVAAAAAAAAAGATSSTNTVINVSASNSSSSSAAVEEGGGVTGKASKVSVRFSTGWKDETFALSKEGTLGELRTLIFQKFNQHIKEPTLIHFFLMGKHLKDDKCTLAMAGVKSSLKLQVFIRPTPA